MTFLLFISLSLLEYPFALACFWGLVWGSSNAHGGVADDGGGVGWDQLDQMMECQVHLSAYGIFSSHVG